MNPSPTDSTGIVQTGDSDAVTLHEWMWSPDGLGLRLTSPDLLIYAKIYQISNHASGAMMASQRHLAMLFDLPRETVNKSLARLQKAGLVIVCGAIRTKGCPGKPINVYAVCQDPIDQATTRSFSTAEICAPKCDGASHLPDLNVTLRHINGTYVSPKRDAPSHLGDTFTEEDTSLSSKNALLTQEIVTHTSTSSGSDLIDKNKNKADTSKPARTDECLSTLLGLSIKPVAERFVPEVENALAALIGDGWDPNEIVRAYHDYIDWYCKAHPDDRSFASSLSHWLMPRNGHYNSFLSSHAPLRTPKSAQREPGKRSVMRTTDGFWIGSSPLVSLTALPGASSEEEAQECLTRLEELAREPSR